MALVEEREDREHTSCAFIKVYDFQNHLQVRLFMDQAHATRAVLVSTLLLTMKPCCARSSLFSS